MIFKCKVSNFRPSREAIFSILHSPKSKSCSYKKRKRQPSVTSSLLPFKMSCLFFLPPCVNNGNDTRKEKDNLKARIWADNKMGGSRHFWARLSRKRSRDVVCRCEQRRTLSSLEIVVCQSLPSISLPLPKIRKKRNHSWMTKEVEERQRNKEQEKMSRMRQQHKRQVPSSESRKITLRDITDRRRTQDTRITRETERMITSSRIQQ